VVLPLSAAPPNELTAVVRSDGDNTPQINEQFFS
jgi:hypothetical protein